MGKCANCGVTLDPSWKFCVMCGSPIDASDRRPAEVDEPAPEPTPEPPPGPSADREADASAAQPAPVVFRPVNLALDEDLDDEIPPRRKVDVALLFGIVMAVGGVVLILVVAIALFTPRG
jgi:hypothetical protein